MSSEGTERRLAAIMFTDIVGYTALMAESEEKGLRVRERHGRVVRVLVERFGGEWIEETGDESLSTFQSAVDAVNCALSIQAAVRDDVELRLRIGVHLGETLAQQGRLYGDGVNVASRIRPLADPGEICISEQVHDIVKNQPNLAFRSLGEQALKNVERSLTVFVVGGRAAGPSYIARAPRRGQRATRLRVAGASVAALLLLVAGGLWASWPRPLGLLIDLAGAGAPPVDPPLPDKPSLVVLPFENMSADSEQEYFSDGITEDLITDLSRSSGLFVIARNSAFTYKGRAVSVEDVGRELGVRYVVEGSVRRDSDRIRVTAQLIDATSGFHLWSERYDRDLVDLFAVQSDLAERIMGAVGIEIRAAEIERIRRKPTKSLSAHDLFLRALHHYMKFSRRDHEKARQLLERAIELDPEYATAHALLGGIYLNEYANLWSLDPTLLDRGVEQAERALAIDESNSIALANKALVLLIRGRTAEARAYAERAVELDPNWDVPHTVLAAVRAQSGDPLGALQSTRRALRRNPKLPSADLSAIADINYFVGRTEIAQDLYERIRATNPDLIPARLQLAMIYESQGRLDEAQVLVQEILQVNPEITADLLANAELFAAWFDANEKAELRDSLRRAGLP